MKKKLLFSLMIIFMICISFCSVKAKLGDGFNTNLYNDVTSEKDTELDNALFNVAGTVMLVLQILAIAGVVITGVKYMYASSDDKGRIKQTLIWVVVGAIFVFAASTVINFITDTGNNIL